MRRKHTVLRLGLALGLMLTMLGMNGCNRSEAKTKSETLVLTVDDSKVYLDEMMYHVMLAEMQGQLYASMVENGQKYWEIVNEDGKTMAEVTLDQAMENAIRYELFYQLALQEGYELTQEAKLECEVRANNLVKNVPATMLEEYELTKEEVVAIQEKIALSTQYYNNMLKDLGIEEDKIRQRIDPMKYQQFSIQFLYATKSDYKLLEDIHDAAKSAQDITTLAKDPKLNAGYATFLKGENHFGAEVELEEAVLKMEKGEVSDIIETSEGYYIVKLTNNTSTSSLDSAVKEELEKEIAGVFPAEYTELKSKHKIKIQEKIWNKVEVGKEKSNLN